MAYYDNLAAANTYFANRLHSTAWTTAVPTDKPKALTQACQIIDNLNYRGVKNSLYLIMYDSDGVLLDTPTQAAIDVANAAQPLEFPRGRDTLVPEPIKMAQWDIAYALLDGFDPDAALDGMRVKSQSYSAVKTTYADGDTSSEYLLYGIPTGTAWRWLKPYLCDGRIIRLRRAD
jgi:hypothetical protein